MVEVIDGIEYVGDVFYGSCLCGKVLEAEEYDNMVKKVSHQGSVQGVVTCPGCNSPAILQLMIKHKTTRYTYS